MKELGLLGRRSGGGAWLVFLKHLVLVGVALIIGGCVATEPKSATNAPGERERPQTTTKPQQDTKPYQELQIAAPTSEQYIFAGDVVFDFGKAVLKPEGKAKLDDLVSGLQGEDVNAIIVIGYADPIGNDAYNQKLSILRAEAVKTYLVSRGIKANRVYTEGKGEKQPIADNKTTSGRAKNRRVEIEVTKTSRRGIEMVPILFATNRGKTGHNVPSNYFSNDETDGKPADRLILGRALVGVPPNHERGQTERPGWILRLLEQLSLGHYKAEKPSEHFYFAYPIEELTTEHFRIELRQSIEMSNTREAILYVHGFGNSFADAAYRTAQLSFDLRIEGLDLVPIMFSWPSDPVISIEGLNDFPISPAPLQMTKIQGNYIGAKDRVESAAQQLGNLLKEIAAATDVGTVHIVAHSMGAEVATRAIGKMEKSTTVAIGSDGTAKSKFKQVILAAPDIRAADFESIIFPAVSSGHRVTNYASSNDKALRLSKTANAGARAGDSGDGLKEVAGVETIDASAVNNEFIGHSYFAESIPMIVDLKELLKDGATPENRGLLPVRRRTWTYWIFPQPYE